MKNTNDKPVSVVSARVESCYFFDGITYDPDGRGNGCPLDDLQTAEKGIFSKISKALNFDVSE